MARVSAEDKTERESTKAVVAEEIVFRLKVLSWPKTWAKLRPLIEILSQNARPRRSGQPREARAPEPQPRRSVAVAARWRLASPSPRLFNAARTATLPHHRPTDH